MNQAPTTAPTVGDVSLFLEAAMLHARDFLAQRGGVPSVMILGRYADEELLFVFPSGQDRDAFQSACIAEAATFGADIAMMVSESTMTLGEGRGETEVVSVHWRERGQPTRLQFAPMHRISDTETAMGPASSLPGAHHNQFTEAVFGASTH